MSKNPVAVFPIRKDGTGHLHNTGPPTAVGFSTPPRPLNLLTERNQ